MTERLIIKALLILLIVGAFEAEVRASTPSIESGGSELSLSPEEIDLSLYLREGKYTKLTPRIMELAENISMSEDPVYVFDAYGLVEGDKTSDLLVEYTPSNDTVKDYIIKALAYVGNNIHQPFIDELYTRELYHQISAHETLVAGVGYCDERAILFKSLMLARGIPVKIVGREWAAEDGLQSIYPHVAAEVWYNNEWVKVDPSFKLFGFWAANGQEIKINTQDW